MKVINEFQGEYRWLSNFIGTIPSLGGVTPEHAYQAAKTSIPDEKAQVLAAPTPGEAKRLSRHITLSADWDQAKVGVMFMLLQEKFSDPEMADRLHATGDAILIEGNMWHDNFWGNCNCQKCKSTFGKNWLGRLLMLVRSLQYC